MLVFETERLYVRPYTMADFDDFFRMNGDEEVMRYIRPAQTREQSKDFLEKIITAYAEKPGIGRWAMFTKENNRFAGSFAVIPVQQTDRLQVGYALLKENWGRGYACESLREGIRYAFDILRLPEVAGITYPENIASQKVLLKNGFVFDSTFTDDNKVLNLYMLYSNRTGHNNQ